MALYPDRLEIKSNNNGAFPRTASGRQARTPNNLRGESGLPSVYAQYPQSRSQSEEPSVPPSGTYYGQTQPSKPARSMTSSTNR